MGTTVDRLTPEGRKFFAEIEKLKRLQVRVGFQDDGTMAAKRDENDNIVDADVTLLDVATWNEVGTAHSPSRPFMRNSADNNQDKINRFCKAQLQQMTKGKTAEEALKAIGVMQKGLIQQEIREGDFTANAPSTIAKKHSDKPLIDTGRMRQSVNFVIKPKGGG